MKESTVKLPTETAAIITADTPTTVPTAAPKKSFTRWDVFVEAKLVPAEIVCQSYAPVHPIDFSCHSRLQDAAASIITHAFDRDHGAGFSLKLRETDGKPWKGWADLAAAGIEATDFRCEVCDKQVPFKPIYIKQHMKAHSGKLKRVNAGGKFWLTVGTGRPEAADDEQFD